MQSVLNLKYYSGQDLYSDGDIEDDLLKMASENEDFSEILKNDGRWPVLYHLSNIRENILDWFPFSKEDTVLEIGSGCGAITGLLCRKTEHVTCIELSKKRSMINEARNGKYNNLEIMVGNFEDIVIEQKFDYVTLIGVLEYSPSYISKGEPFTTMLNKIKSFLKPGGKIIIAIENKFGLKYFAGATEDHTGKLFDGLEDYNNVSSVRTFSKPELSQLLNICGFDNLDYYYPIPDYKMPTTIYSDKFLPNRGELRNITMAYDRERYRFFNEEVTFDQLCDDNMFPYFANSFLVVGEMK